MTPFHRRLSLPRLAIIFDTFEIALCAKEHDTQRNSNKLEITVSGLKFERRLYEPNAIRVASVQTIEHGDNVLIYFDLPPQVLGNSLIAFRVRCVIIHFVQFEILARFVAALFVGQNTKVYNAAYQSRTCTRCRSGWRASRGSARTIASSKR